MNSTRRQFLQRTLAGTSALSLGLAVPRFLQSSAAAMANRQASAAGRILVVVQLSGGNDGLNTVIPYRDPAYAKNRVALRIPASQVLTLNDEVGLHPRLTGLAQLWEDRQLAVVQGVGYPNPNRSHFESMDIWHSCQRDRQQQRTGWLGRALDATPSAQRSDLPALHLGRGELPLPLAARRTAAPSAPSLEACQLRTSNGALPSSALREIADSAPADNDAPLAQFLQQTMLTALDASQKVQETAAQQRTAQSYPATGLGGKLRTVAQLIDAEVACPIYYVSLDGFDTHANQAAAHAALMGELSGALAAFTTDLQARGHLDRVLVMTFSEFGRRVKENASLGTDHGAAAPMMLLGNQVHAGCIGAHPSLTDLDDGDLKHHTDFRSVYSAVLEDWLGCPAEPVIGQKFERVKILG